MIQKLIDWWNARAEACRLESERRKAREAALQSLHCRACQRPLFLNERPSGVCVNCKPKGQDAG